MGRDMMTQHCCDNKYLDLISAGVMKGRAAFGLLVQLVLLIRFELTWQTLRKAVPEVA